MPSAGTIGSCLLANELEGMGKEMLEMRIKGDSWATIAQKFDLPNPSAARAKFTKLTGITDYKAKGHVLKNMADDLAAKASKTGIFEAKKAEKKVKKALDIDADLNDLTGFQKISMKQYEKDYGKDHPVYKQKLQQYKADNALKATPKAVVESVAKDLPEVKPAKWKPNQQIMEDSGLSVDQIGKIIEMNEKGHGYLAIKNATGAEFKQIDEVVWNSLLKKNNGDIWQAYLDKVTSQSGFDAVQQKVLGLKKGGFSNEEIAKITGMPPKEVIDSIVDGKWKIPAPGATKPIIPPSPPKPPAVYGKKVETGYPFKSPKQMDEWITRADNEALSATQRGALKNYTGSGSRPINDYLRKGTVSDSGFSNYTATSLERTVKSIDATMRPVPEAMKVTRHVNTDAFGTTNLESLVGDVFRDKGYLSTSISETGVFSSHPVKMIIDIPPGAQARWVDRISANQGEQEVLLARNTPIKINSVERTSGGTDYYGNPKPGKWIVHGEVVV